MEEPLKLIEQYLDNELPAAERERFEQRLKEDTAFAQAFQVEKDVRDGIEALGNQNLKSELKTIYQEEVLDREATIRPMKRRRWWLMAAAAIAALLLSWWLWPERLASAEELYASYFQPEYSYTERGNQEQLISRAEAKLRQGAYAEALPLLEQLLSVEPGRAEFQLAKGIALVETGQYEKGLAALQKSGTLSPTHQNEALWYEALAWLKQGDLERTLEVLEEIPSSSARYPQAQALKRKVQLLTDKK